MKKKKPVEKSPLTREQVLVFMNRFSAWINWKNIDEESAKRLLKFSGKEFGSRFTAFILSGAGVKPGQLKVKTAPFDPANFFGNGLFTFWRGPLDGDGLRGKLRTSLASRALEEVDFEDVRLVHCDEQEHVWRTELKTEGKRSIILGSTVFAGLIADYNSNKKEKNKILYKLYHQKGISRIRFTGDVFRDPQGKAITLTMQTTSSGLWQWSYEWAFRPAFLPKSKLPIKRVEISPKMKADIAKFMGPKKGLVSPGL